MAFWVYILRCADDRFYTGHTDNLDLRIAQHQHGEGGAFTAQRRPVTLMWTETFATREEALAAELQIKPWSRAKKQALIDGDFARLSYFAKPPAERPSTSLGTNGDKEGTQLSAPLTSHIPLAGSASPASCVPLADSPSLARAPSPFVSSEVETRKPEESK